jgi:hypothetical protein
MLGVLMSKLSEISEDDWEQFRLLGDINRDGVIDDDDCQLLLAAFPSKPGDPNWNPEADLDGDGEVGINDLLILGRNAFLDIWTWKGVEPPPKITVPPAGLLAVIAFMLAVVALI